jgi:hypothetical protein
MKRKGLVGLVLGGSLCILFCTLGFAQEATLNLDTTQYGTELEAVVNLTNSGNAVAAQFDIVYDRQALEPVTETEIGDALSSSGFNVSTARPSPGIIRIVIIPPITSPLPTLPDGAVAKVNFSILSDKAPVPVLSNVVLSDANGKNLATDR